MTLADVVELALDIREVARMATVHFLLLVLAFVAFALAALGVSSPRVQLTPLGLACWVLSLLLP